MKKFILLLIPLLVLTFLANPVIAEGQQSPIPPTLPEIVSGGKITVNETSYELYPVYADPLEAITAIRSIVPDLLRTLSKAYLLPPLSDRNWEQYRDAMIALLDSPARPVGYSEADPDCIALRAFFDIYENTGKNAAILDYVEGASRDSGICMEDLTLLLPSK